MRHTGVYAPRWRRQGDTHEHTAFRIETRHSKVQDAQGVCLSNKRYGEELCAWVLTRAGETLSEDEIRDFCKGKIAHYKVPRYIRFVTGFPMTVTGKIQKFKIRDEMKSQLGLEEDPTA